MMTELRHTFSRVLNQLKTHFILKRYAKADFDTQAKFRQKELTHIANNQYDMEAYFRLSLMSPKKTPHVRNVLTNMGVSDCYVNTRLSQLHTSHSRISNAFLKLRGI